MKGVAVGVVTNNKDTGGLGRVKVCFAWNPKQESDWARVAAPMAGKGRGAYFLPDVGDEVLVAFDRGDPRHPYVLGALWNGQDRPPATNTDGKNAVRVIRTRHGHELRFDDEGQHAVELHTKDGKRLLLDDQKVVLTDEKQNEITIDSTSGAISVKSSTSLKLESPRIEVSASASLTLKAGGTVTIQGAIVQIN